VGGPTVEVVYMTRGCLLHDWQHKGQASLVSTAWYTVAALMALHDELFVLLLWMWLPKHHAAALHRSVA
jgi:hypothetical protein